MRSKKYTVIEDPGHAWLKVLRRELIELGIQDDISRYSYQRGDYVYLEEDCDAVVFLNALRDNGKMYQLVSAPCRMKRSKIRSYDMYRPTRLETIAAHSDNVIIANI